MIPVIYSSSNSSNPTYSSLYKYLERLSDPELLLLDVSYCTINEIVAACQSSDLIVIDNFVHVAARLNPNIFSSVTLVKWRGVDFYSAIWDIATSSNSQVLYIASGWDLHWPGPDLDLLLRKIHGIAWMFEREPIDISKIPIKYKDFWMSTNIDPALNWRKVIDTVKVRIEMSHHVSFREMFSSSVHAFWETCIPGVSYKTRKVAKLSAQANDLKVAPYSLIDSLILGATATSKYLFGNSNASIARNGIRYSSQRFFTSRSAVNFVCGSGYKYPVRKFFEIPACRSAMIAYPFEGMIDFGFIDGTNCIYADPSDFGSEAKTLLNNAQLKNNLIDSAFQLISRLHLTEIRALDYVKCIKLMASGSLKASRFFEGSYLIEHS